jgi:CheY-like chemotaxis protein
MEVKTALVVDDSKSARFALRKFLESKGYAVDTADGASEAYIYLKKKRPDIVFLDHMMPGVDGFDALRAMRLEPELASMPIVICSSNEGDAFVREARAQGATDVLPKPPSQVHIDAVLARIPPHAPQAPAPVAASPKVQPIREPEVMIERAVMKTVREAIPEASLRPATPPPPAPTPVPVAPVMAPAPVPQHPPPPAVAPTPVHHAPVASAAPSRPAATIDQTVVEHLRNDLELRLRKIAQDLYVQLGELKAQLAVVDGALKSHSDDQVRAIAVEAAQAQTEELSRSIEGMFNTLRADVESVLEQQSKRIDAIVQAVRETAAEEAHAVAERVVMNAAVRISDQMAESFLRVLRPWQEQQQTSPQPQANSAASG